MGSFLDVSACSLLSEGTFSFQPTDDWMQGRTLFGGVVGAVATRAILEVREEPERSLRSLLVSFVAPVHSGEALVSTQVLRTGKGITQIEARVQQDGQVCAVVQAVLGVPHDSFLSVEHLVMPEVTRPEEIPAMPYVEGMMPAFIQHIDYRWTVDSYPYSGAEQAHCQGWVKFQEEHVVGYPELVGLLDAWPPPIFSRANGFVPGSSVTWLINFFSRMEPSSVEEDWWFYDPVCTAIPGELHDLPKTSPWFFYDSRCTASHEGYADSFASLWDAHGTLLARSRQLVVEFSK